MTSSDPFAPALLEGGRFSNPSGRSARPFKDVLRWMWTRKRSVWPEIATNPPAPKPIDRVNDGSIHVTPVGHATVLIQVAGLNIITDPVWSRCAGPFPWLGVKRIRPPAIAFDDLPKIDTILLSHNHYDHLDRTTIAALTKRDAPLLLTGKQTSGPKASSLAVELDWWQSDVLNKAVRVTYVPAEHFSGRGPFDRNKNLWGGFVLETPAGNIYFAGDTGDGTHFAAIREKFGPMRLSLIPIGAYEPRWFMSPIHINPAEAVAASLTLESAVTLAIHFGTFHLADDGFDSPERELEQAIAAVRQRGLDIDFRVPVFGAPIVLTP